MIKALNGYAGIGGNRKLWPDDVEVTAVELNPDIAAIYQDFFPQDTVIVGDAHQYLLEHYDDGWDFIWSSPPCQSHSFIRFCGVSRGITKPIYPEMALWQEIIFLQWHCKTQWVVENVHGYYEPLIQSQNVGRHRFWSNFTIPELHIEKMPDVVRSDWKKLSDYYGFSIPVELKNKRQILRNCVNPKLGQHIFNCAFKLKQSTLEV